MGSCALCGGPLIAMTRAHGKRRAHFYGCAYHLKRGATVCQNSVQIRQEILDQAVLQAVSEALDDRIIEAAVDRALRRLREGREGHLDRRTAIERELSLIEAHERRLVEAIKRGEAVEPLVTALKAEEERKAALTAELASLADLDKVVALDAKRLEQDLRRKVADVRGVLTKHVPQARQVLRQMLVGRLTFEPVQRGYRFVGTGSYGRSLTGVTSHGVPDGTRKVAPIRSQRFYDAPGESIRT